MHANYLSTKRDAIERPGARSTYSYLDSIRLHCESTKSATRQVTRVTFEIWEERVTISGGEHPHSPGKRAFPRGLDAMVF
jgi:hypothetical protein